MDQNVVSLFSPAKIEAAGPGPRYVKLRRLIEEAISSQDLSIGTALPTEREIATLTALSRVTVRKAVEELVAQGRLVRRHGSGTFVGQATNKVEQPLSLLTSFTEDMARRGVTTTTKWLRRELMPPSPNEMMTLGLSMDDRIAKLERLRLADGKPMAIERAAVLTEFVPDPKKITGSLYAELGKRNARPVRATQRISARNIDAAEATLLDVSPGDAGLYIERISYLPSGRVIEFTQSFYRGDTYDFVAELKLSE
ncbi:MAG: GntR family transcriptional regulator [Stappiaceae bacterium]